MPKKNPNSHIISNIAPDCLNNMYQVVRGVDMPRSILHKNLAVLILISTVSTSLAIIAFVYSIQTSQHIRQIASEDIANSARDESYDLSRIVVNRIKSVT